MQMRNLHKKQRPMAGRLGFVMVYWTMKLTDSSPCLSSP